MTQADSWREELDGQGRPGQDRRAAQVSTPLAQPGPERSRTPIGPTVLALVLTLVLVSFSGSGVARACSFLVAKAARQVYCGGVPPARAGKGPPLALVVRSCSAATPLGTHIRHASMTSSCASPMPTAASLTRTQLYRISD